MEVLDSPSSAGEGNMKRTSSQTSGASTKSKTINTIRSRPQKTLSNSSSISSLKRDPSLTSFPSLSPEQANAKQVVPETEATPQPSRTISQKTRDRRKTLATLTSASKSVEGRDSLFDDSPRPSLDVPGALHLASDQHIERLISGSGAVTLVRQFAQDLAQRDAELSALRVRADDRERELKKMLREVEVSSANIEKRLRDLEHLALDSDQKEADPRPAIGRKMTNRIDDMVHQAMSEEVGSAEDDLADADGVDLAATVRLTKPGGSKSTKPTAETNQSRSRGGSVSGWQFWNSNATSPDTSRASSILIEDADEVTETVKPRLANSNVRRRGLDSLFQPSSQSTSYFIGGAKKTLKKPVLGDDASMHSQKSGRSITGWTKLFAGTSQSKKDEQGRPRSSSLEQSNSDDPKTSAAAAESAILSRVKTNPQGASAASTIKSKPSSKRMPSLAIPSTGPDHIRKGSDAVSLGPVEMDAILPVDSKPPTMTNSYDTYQTEGLFTDSFGFIYDQRQRKRQRQLANHQKNKLSNVESLRGLKDSESDEEVGHVDHNSKLQPILRPATPASIVEEAQPKKWSDYLKVPSKTAGTRPTQLLLHIPSSQAIVTVNSEEAKATPPRNKVTSISVNSQQALPTTSLTPKPTQSIVTASTPIFANNQNPNTAIASASEQEPVKLLLEQLTELHDNLQAEREAKFNDFLRKVRAERSSNAAFDRNPNNAPEADLPNGEIIGDLGHSKNRSKYSQFKALVLAGIPVSLRPKIWAECSGATTLRIPGYYDDLVARCANGDNLDPEIAQQIAADIPRTLTDNVFFRHGPGMGHLTTILQAYSLHNPRIGYCQGMNLVTGNLLLICGTKEEVFWLLVAIIDKILPSGYFDRGLVVCRADQIVLRGYVAEVLPNLSAKLDALGVELEAFTFVWFLSMFSQVVSAEGLFRIWDVVLCLNSSEAPLNESATSTGKSTAPHSTSSQPTSPTATTSTAAATETAEHDGTSSPFLFQLSLALLKLNESALLSLDSAAAAYSYVNHSMTNHAVSIDGLIGAAEALKVKVKWADVLMRREKAVLELGG